MDKIPAYHSSGLKKHTRILSPVRNQKIINVPLLCSLLQKHTKNDVKLESGRLVIDGVEVTITEGVVATGRLKFRFKDIFDLLESLKVERIIICKKEKLYTIRHEYFKRI